jgi:hypothetical protein
MTARESPMTASAALGRASPRTPRAAVTAVMVHPTCIRVVLGIEGR